MKKYLFPLSALLLIGCQQPTKNTITYQGLTCSCLGSVKLVLNGSKGYECVCSDKKYIKPVKKTNKNYTVNTQKHDFKNPSWLNTAPITKCETTVTNIYKDGSVRCKGKLLESGKKSKIVRVNK